MPAPPRPRRSLPLVLLAVVAAVALPAVPAAAADTGWPQFGRTARHLNTNPGELTFTPVNVARGLQIAARDDFMGDSVDSTVTEGGAAVAGGTAYIAGFDGNLSAFAFPAPAACAARPCAPRWRGHTDNDITSTPAVAGGLVLVGSADHFLYAFPAAGCGRATCPPRWKGQLGDAVIDSSVAVAGGFAYVGDFGGTLYAFPVNGCGKAVCRPAWTGQAGPNEALTSSPAVANGNVYIGSFISTPEEVTGRLLVFPAAGCGRATCRPSWTADIGGPAGRTGAPTVAGDTVFMGSTTHFGGVDGQHLFAFAAGGCGASTCRPLRAYDVGDGGVDSTPAVAGGVLYASTQNTPDPNTVGVVAAFPAAGCGKAVCEPRWTGVNFAGGFESSPVVVGGVVFVGKGPASGFPVDAGVYGFDARGCGAVTCRPLTFAQLGLEQNYLGAPLAVTGGRVLMATNDNTAGRSLLYELKLAG